MLTPKFLNLSSDPQDNDFLSWAHSSAAFHNQSNCWVFGTLPSSSVEIFPWWTSPLQGNTQENNPKMVGCNTLYFNYGYNLTFKFDCSLSRYNDEFATYKANRSRSNGFLPDIYQVWNEVIWLTPEKGRLMSTAPICWEQIEPSPDVSWQPNYSGSKHGIFVSGKMQYNHSPLFQTQFRSSLFLARHWLGLNISVRLACSNQDLLDIWILPMGMASRWLDRDCTLGPAFTHGFIFSELP